MISHIAIDGRMWDPFSTGIGNYIREISQRLFVNMPETAFTLFLPPTIFESYKPPAHVTTICAPEPIYSLSEQTTFLRKLQKCPADLFWFPHFNVPLLFRKPFIVTIHDLTLLKFQGKKMRRSWHHWAYLRILHHSLFSSKALLSVSDFTKEEILDFAPKIPEKKITRIWNGIEKERFQNIDLRKKSCFQKKFGETFFLVAGVWREHKNVVGAIRAFEIFREKGEKGRLVITGREDKHYPEVREMSEKSPFSEDILLTGYIPFEDIPALISASTALIFPSFAEGFGLPLLEAMAANTPVLCSNTSSLPEVGGDACLYFDPKNTKEIAQSMKKILQKEEQVLLQKKGQKRLHLFSWDEAAQETQMAFERMEENMVE